MKKVESNEASKKILDSIYLAAKYSRREEMEGVASELTDLGYDVTSSWVYGGEEGKTKEEIALLDKDDLFGADAVISFTEPHGTYHPGGGRHVEFGMGYAMGMRLILIGPRENVFHYLPEVEQYDSLDDFLEYERS